ncbi:MAG: paraquat-inducible protein A [Victivallales bacterium]|nr:paraquat-inducible protein A [Victivallales bacterium]MCF7889412.1 paraquat-inducible protein A [Victivallales bacterium]
MKIFKFRNGNSRSLYRQYGNSGIIVNILLIVSFICNILALTVPFTEFGHFLSNPVSCTLPYSVYLLWYEGLYGISVLILGFSILFPFVKLFILIYAWMFETEPGSRHRQLGFVEPLGKWSMLDVFATCIIIILCNKQILIYGYPMIGVDFFLTAIFLSMISSLIIHNLHMRSGKKAVVDTAETENPNELSVKMKIMLMTTAVISLLSLIIVIWLPYIKISSFLLFNYSYSIYDSAVSLMNSSVVLSLFIMFTLIFFPLLHIISIIIYLTLKFMNKKHYPKLAYTIKVFSRFNMLDVFLLAFIVFISEGSSFIKTDQLSGLYLICFFIFTSLIIPYLLLSLKHHIQLLRTNIKHWTKQT